MSYLLVTNDDGVESPALLPLIRALSDLAPVETVVPDSQRSWIGKAITRYDDLIVHRVMQDGVEVHVASGYPADCVQLGVHTLFDDRPLMVVSGVNVGYNSGLAFTLGSGTVGAAVEGFIVGVPSAAFSLGTARDYRTWSAYAWSPESIPMWERAAAVTVDIVRGFLEEGLPAGAEVVSVNMPEEVEQDSPREITRLAVTSYAALFEPDGDRYVHSFRGGLQIPDDLAGTDIGATRAGRVSITPLVFSRLAEEGEFEVGR